MSELNTTIYQSLIINSYLSGKIIIIAKLINSYLHLLINYHELELLSWPSEVHENIQLCIYFWWLLCSGFELASGTIHGGWICVNITFSLQIERAAWYVGCYSKSWLFLLYRLFIASNSFDVHKWQRTTSIPLVELASSSILAIQFCPSKNSLEGCMIK